MDAQVLDPGLLGLRHSPLLTFRPRVLGRTVWTRRRLAQDMTEEITLKYS